MLAEKTAWPERVVRGARPKNRPVIIEDGSSWGDADGFEIDGGIRREPLPDAAPEGNARMPGTRRSRPQDEPSFDDDLDPLPPARSPKRPSRETKPAPANDEDLPEAMPEPAASKPKTERKPQTPKPEVRPKAEVEDIPDLEAPTTDGSSRPGR
jgi:hypothetical protein